MLGLAGPELFSLYCIVGDPLYSFRPLKGSNFFVNISRLYFFKCFCGYAFKKPMGERSEPGIYRRILLKSEVIHYAQLTKYWPMIT